MTHAVEDQDEVLAFLAGGAWAAVEREEVSCLETHGAYVFLAGDRARKIKRAVRYPYMDFSTLEKRRRACETELRINRRTAPELYLAVEPVTRADGGGLEIGGAGEVVEWSVLMRRFPQECLLDRMAEEGRLEPRTITELADAIARFHAEAERAPADAPHGGGAALTAMLDGSLAELDEKPEWFEPREVGRLREKITAATARAAPVLDRRKREGFVRRCHGDLHLGNVCLIDGRPTLFDAIEFNEALAWLDVMHDLAFVLMDLDHRSLRPYANLLLTRYVMETEDFGGLGALPLLLADRALVRAKVKAATAEGADDRDRLEQLRQEALAYFAAALGYVEPAPSLLVAVGGLSGTGKSTLAGRIAPLTGAAPGAVHLRSDVIRKRLAGVPETERLGAEFYAEATSETVYGRMLDLAGRVLATGHSVVLDAVFARPEERAAAAQLAGEFGVAFRGLWLEAPLGVLTERVEGRKGDASDATADVVRLQSGFDVGRIDWEKVAAAAGPDAVEAAARRLLGR